MPDVKKTPLYICLNFIIVSTVSTRHHHNVIYTVIEEFELNVERFTLNIDIHRGDPSSLFCLLYLLWLLTC